MITKRFLYTILLGLTSSLMISSCGPTPCSCANAQMNNDSEGIRECDEHLSKMSTQEQLEFNKKFVECLGV